MAVHTGIVVVVCLAWAVSGGVHDAGTLTAMVLTWMARCSLAGMAARLSGRRISVPARPGAGRTMSFAGCLPGAAPCCCTT